MKELKFYVQQDGADFYVYLTPACNQLHTTRSAPFKVSTSDMDAANRARLWFMQLCSEAAKRNLVWPTIDEILAAQDAERETHS